MNAYDDFIEEIERFKKQHGIYPEKIIMNYTDLLNIFDYVRKYIGDIKLHVTTSTGAVVRIELDALVSDWILVAPEFN